MNRPAAAITGPAIALIVWAFLARVVANASLLPTPWSVARRFVRDIQSPLLWQAIATTASESLVGALIGASLALPLAFAVYKSTFLDAAVSPLIHLSQAIPSVALAPLLVIWLGYGLWPISILCALIVFFPILTTFTLGLTSLPRDVIEAARLDGAHGWTLLRYIEAPMALPSLLTGLRTGFTLSVIGAVVGEYVMGGTGLGQRLSLQSTTVDMTGLFATVAILCLFALAIVAALRALERRILAQR